MLLLEGGQCLDHLRNPSQHMETAPVMETIAPTKSRSRHHRHSALSHHLPGGGRYLPIYSSQDDEENELVRVLQGSIPALSQRRRQLVCQNIQCYSSFLSCSQRVVFSKLGQLLNTNHTNPPTCNPLPTSFGSVQQDEEKMITQPSLWYLSVPVEEDHIYVQQGCNSLSFGYLVRSICQCSFGHLEGHHLCQCPPS